jgi:hypothetical protein
LSNALERIAPFGLFIVLALIFTGLLTPLIGPPIGAIMGLITTVFRLPVG